MNYNAYFPGNAIAMARVLFDGVVEYDDGENKLSTVLNPISNSVVRHPRHFFSIGQRCRYFPQLGI